MALPTGPTPYFPAGTSAQTPEAQTRYIVDLVNSGQKLSTQDILALQTSLAGLQGVQNQDLRNQATQILTNYTGGLQDVWKQAADAQAQSLANQAGYAQQANAQDVGAVNYLQGQAQNANDVAGGTLANVYGNFVNNDAVNRALYEQYGNTLAGLNDYQLQGVNNVGAAANQANAGNQALFGQYGNTLAGLNNYELQGVNNVASAANATNAANQRALLGMLQAGSSANANDANTIAALNRANQSVQQYAPVGYGAPITSMAGQAAASPADIAAERTSLQGFQNLSDPTITATERYNMELARRNEEQDQRAALDAALADLSARGIRSGGAEIGALLGSAQNTGQQRSLADMAALQQANDRALQARSQAAQLASTMRGQGFGEALQAGQASDAVSQFNKAQSLAQSNYQTEQAIAQQQAAFQRAQQLANTTLGNTQDIYGRAAGAFQAGQGVNQANLGNTQQSFNNATTVGGNIANNAGNTFQAGQGVNQANLGNIQQSYTNAANATNDVANRAQSQAQLGVGIDQQSQQNAQNLANMGLNATDQAYSRGKDVAAGMTGATQTAYNRLQGTEADTRQAAQNVLSGAGQVANEANNVAAVMTGQAPQPIYDSLGNIVASNEANAARNAVKNQGGLLGGAIIPGVL